MSNKKLFDSENVPAWARYNGETYIAGFSGTAKQKRESEKALKGLLSKHHKSRRARKRNKVPAEKSPGS